MGLLDIMSSVRDQRASLVEDDKDFDAFKVERSSE
jgi:hypothetical protein